MPLRFDPSAVLAPGGIVSGLDDLGSAVVQALNRRAERRYATDAAAKSSAERESQFSRQLEHGTQIQRMQNDASLDRTRVTQGSENVRKLVGEGGATFRNLATNATRMFDSVTDMFHGTGKSSTSVDGKDAEMLLKIDEEGRKLYPDPKYKSDALMAMLDPTSAAADKAAYDKEVAELPKKRAAYTDAKRREMGFVQDPNTKAWARPRAGVAAPAATPVAEDPAKVEAWSRAQKNGWSREQFEAKWAERQKGK